MRDLLTSFLAVAQRALSGAPVQLWFQWFLVGAVIETIVQRPTARESFRRYAVNVGYSLIYLAAIFLLAPTAYTLVASIRDAVGLHGLMKLHFFDGPGLVNQLAVFTLYFCILDFFQYWWHRAQHRFPILWDQHVVHHSDEALNVTTATRHHWTEFLFQAFAIALPLTMLFDITPASAGIVALIFGAWQFFVHLNVPLHLGPIAWLIAGPQVHRIHHSSLKEHRDKNFAAYLPIWDVLFGTYHHPKRKEFPPTGADGVKLETVWSLSVHPFRRWGWRLARRWVRARSRQVA